MKLINHANKRHTRKKEATSINYKASTVGPLLEDVFETPSVLSVQEGSSEEVEFKTNKGRPFVEASDDTYFDPLEESVLTSTPVRTTVTSSIPRPKMPVYYCCLKPNYKL